MKNLITLILLVSLSFACNKKNKKPKEPDPICNPSPDSFTGKYYTYNTSSVDTLTIVFIQSNCPTQNSNKYKLINVSGVFATWGVGITSKDYIIDINESTLKGEIPNEMFVDIQGQYLRISARENSVSKPFTPYLQLKKKK